MVFKVYQKVINNTCGIRGRCDIEDTLFLEKEEDLYKGICEK